MRTIIQMFEDSVSRYSKNVYIWEKENGAYVPTTYQQTYEEVQYIAAGFLDLGLGPGSRVGLLSEGRKLWIETELGMLAARYVDVPLSVKLEGVDLVFRLNHSEAKALVVSGNHAKKIEQIREQIPGVKYYIYLDGKDSYAEGEMGMADLIARGKKALGANPDLVEHSKRAIQPSDWANISYTSGTTADPKGIILTHRNYTANTEQSLTLMEIPEYYVTLLILPLDHSFAHVAGIFSFMASGASVAIVQAGKSPMEALRNIPTNMKEIKPHLLLSVPALAKNFRKNIEVGVKGQGTFARWLFQSGMYLANVYNRDGFDRGKGARCLLKPILALYDRLLFRKIREIFGGRLEFFIGGGAYLDKDLQKFFYALGIPMMQGYGLSEATPIISSNALHRHKLGSSGCTVQPLEVRIENEQGQELPVGQKGEICVRGENVMLGYWKNEKATAETLRGGWLHTGDMGYVDRDGFLYVLGRFKSLLIGMDGEKYSPEGIEETLVQVSPLLDQALLHNNQQPYTTAFLVPSREGLKAALRAAHVEEDSERAVDEAIRLLEAEVNRFKGRGDHAGLFPERWLPSAFTVIEEPFSEQNGFVNSTMKVVRTKVEKHYKDRLEYLYTVEGKQPCNEMNRKAIRRLLGM